MSFASLLFLWVFLPVVLAVYWVFPATGRNYVLSAASVVFYSYGAHDFTAVLLLMVAFNYGSGLYVGGSHPARSRDVALSLAVAANLGVLCYWKYGGFFDQQVVDLSRLFGGHYRRTIETTLPLGISFFTFHNISYLVDIRREVKPPIRKPIVFATYILMFPQLVAGPIVRYHEIADQLVDVRKDRAGDLAAGFPRFAHGLFKKAVIADSIAPIADAAFGVHSGLSTSSAWIGTLAYTLQIYFDFSGYSDMAIGMGTMFGFKLPENFARPYSAESVTDFWRRWHMSLSRWIRDYLYIPLGGNRKSRSRTYVNLVVVFALTGLWHGAAWTFLLWGLYHGTLLILERTRRDRGRGAGRLWVGRLRTFVLVMIGWVLFRSSGIGPAVRMLGAMVIPRHLAVNQSVSLAMTRERTLIMIAATLVVLVPAGFVTGPFLDDHARTASAWARLGMSTAGAAVAALFVASGTFHPFLYYQF